MFQSHLRVQLEEYDRYTILENPTRQDGPLDEKAGLWNVDGRWKHHEDGNVLGALECSD